MFDRFEEEEVVMFRDMCGKTRAERNKVVVPVLEEQGVRVPHCYVNESDSIEI